MKIKAYRIRCLRREIFILKNESNESGGPIQMGLPKFLIYYGASSALIFSTAGLKASSKLFSPRKYDRPASE